MDLKLTILLALSLSACGSDVQPGPPRAEALACDSTVAGVSCAALVTDRCGRLTWQGGLGDTVEEMVDWSVAVLDDQHGDIVELCIGGAVSNAACECIATEIVNNCSSDIDDITTACGIETSELIEGEQSAAAIACVAGEQGDVCTAVWRDVCGRVASYSLPAVTMENVITTIVESSLATRHGYVAAWCTQYLANTDVCECIATEVIDSCNNDPLQIFSICGLNPE